MVTLFAPKMFEHNSNNGSTEGSEESQTEEPRLAPLSNATTRDLVLLFKMLGDDTRVRELHYLTQRDELNVRTLCKLLGQSQPADTRLASLRQRIRRPCSSANFWAGDFQGTNLLRKPETSRSQGLRTKAKRNNDRSSSARRCSGRG